MSDGSDATDSISHDLLPALRAETASLHRQLDERVSAFSILNRDGYIRFLTMHARILPAAEAWLQRQTEFSAIPDATSRLRAAALSADLLTLGVQMPQTAGMSFLNENSSVAGMCYVLEGSRLGGAYLTSKIVANGRDYPLNFLRHGQERSFWKTFVSWLSTQQSSPSGVERATLSARNMFNAYLAALD